MHAAADILRTRAAPAATKKLLKEARIAPAALDEALRAGLVFRWPKFRGGERVWHRAPETVVREAVLAALRERALPKPELVRCAAAASFNAGTKLVRAGVAAMLADGAIATAKVVGTSALCYAPAHPQALADACYAEVEARLGKLGIAAAVPARAARPGLMDVIRGLQPGPFVPVAVSAVRARAGMEKRAFDEAILALADSGVAYLTTHDHGWALPEAEREQLVSDGGGKLYAAVTLRS